MSSFIIYIYYILHTFISNISYIHIFILNNTTYTCVHIYFKTPLDRTGLEVKSSRILALTNMVKALGSIPFTEGGGEKPIRKYF